MALNSASAAAKLRDRFDRALIPALAAPALRQGALLFFASSAGNVLQYGFHVFASRMLGPGEYGVLTALLALSTIVGVPAGIAQMVITQFIAGLNAQKEHGKVAALLLDALGKLILAGIGVAVGIGLAGNAIAAFLHLSSPLPVYAMASALALAGGIVAMTGALQGLQRFRALAATGIIAPGSRWLFGWLLIASGYGAAGALGGTTAANLVVLAVGFLALRDALGAPKERHQLAFAAVSRYAALVLLGTLALAVITNVDLIVVKHFFSAEEAGYYSAASVLGKTILFFPGAVFTIIFPKISHRAALGERSADLARAGFLVTLALCGSAALTLFVFPSFAVRLLFGSQYDFAIPLVGWYGVAMGLCAITQLLWMIYSAQAEARFVGLLVATALTLTLVLWFFHATLFQVIVTLAVSAFALVTVSELWLGGLGLKNWHG